MSKQCGHKCCLWGDKCCRCSDKRPMYEKNPKMIIEELYTDGGGCNFSVRNLEIPGQIMNYSTNKKKKVKRLICRDEFYCNNCRKLKPNYSVYKSNGLFTEINSIVIHETNEVFQQYH